MKRLFDQDPLRRKMKKGSVRTIQCIYSRRRLQNREEVETKVEKAAALYPVEVTLLAKVAS